MELTSNEMEKEIQDFYHQRSEQFRYNKLQQHYRKLSKEQLNLNIVWTDHIFDVDKDYILNEINLVGLDNLINNFSVCYLNIDAILKYHCGGVKNLEKIFPKYKLWDTRRNDSKLTKLIHYIKEGNKLCPPIIDFIIVQETGNEMFALFDGNHRSALCRFLGIKQIPFIVRNSNLDRVKAISEQL